MKVDTEILSILDGVLKTLLPRLQEIAKHTQSPLDDYLVLSLSWLVGHINVTPDTKD